MTPRDDYEANWNRMTDGQDHVLSQADALTKKLDIKKREKAENLQKLFTDGSIYRT